MIETWIMVISMWGFTTDKEWVPIGQASLQQPFSETQCQQLVDDEKWEIRSENPYYKLVVQCYPSKCSGAERCDT